MSLSHYRPLTLGDERRGAILNALRQETDHLSQCDGSHPFPPNYHSEHRMRYAVLALAPFLSSVGVQKIVQHAQQAGAATFYGVPLLVSGAYHEYELSCCDDFYSIEWKGCYRDPDSYKHFDAPYHDRLWGQPVVTVSFQRIKKFVEKLHPVGLLQDKWRDVTRFVFADPAQRDKHHDLKIQCAVTVAFNYQGRFGSNYMIPPLSEFESSIVSSSTHPMVAAEIAGSRPITTLYQCSRCAGGLGLTRCTYCRTPIVARRRNREFTTLPAPSKVITKLPDQFPFQWHPYCAIKQYYHDWGREGYAGVDACEQTRAQQDKEESSYDRVISLENPCEDGASQNC